MALLSSDDSDLDEDGDGTSIDGYATAKLESRRFNPKMQSVPYPYYIERFYTVSCTPDMPFIVPFMGPMPITMGSPSIYPGRLDFPVDTMVLSGTAYLVDGPDKKPDPNSVPPIVAPKLIAVADKTEYVTQPSTLARTVNDYFDFDGDGQNETVVKGYLKDTPNPDTGVIEKVFTTEGVDAVDAKLHLQGVYLSSGSRIPGQDAPDFTRAMDWSTNFTDEGMVKSISESDLRNTDLYVFRLSDGKLISERLGLAPDDWQYSDELGASAQTSRFFYHTYMRGYYGDLFRRIKGTYVNELNFGDWQAKSGINPELHQRQADHLKPGDRVELIAINRATGYMGSVQTNMQAAGSDAGLGRDLSWDIAPIKLQPPNLKIWVDRKYNINEGLRKGTIIKDHIVSGSNVGIDCMFFRTGFAHGQWVL